jgi:conjugal transfer pilus assembly protein TraF
MNSALGTRVSNLFAAVMIVSATVTPIAVLAQETPASDSLAIDAGPARAGDAFYCQERRLGTWFYCDAPKETEPKGAAPSSAMTPKLAAQQLKDIGEQLEELKALAVLEPTTQNVTAYIRYQREQLDRASTFADMWGRSVWQHPDLDYSLQRPVNTVGKKVWSDQRRADRTAVMASLSQRYGVFYFYSSACGACDIFAPILRSISDQFGLSVLAVSMDGGPTSSFPGYVVDTGQYQKMGLSGGQVPALVLFDTVTKQPIPIGYGLLSADEVMQRIFYLTNVKPGSDY